MTSAITATGLRRSFSGNIVLHGINLEVGAGTTFSLLGPNGAGKTTIVQIVSTLVHADGGETGEVRGHTSYGDINIRRSRLASGTGEEGNHDHQPIPAGDRRGRATTAGQRRRARRRRRHRKGRGIPMTAQPVTAQPVQAIHVQGLEKSYKKLRALRGVDFDVARGSIFALLGSNGAGKTTVLKILSTLLKLDAGTATVDGFDVAAQPADVRESISLTGQFAAVDEILTGRENLVLMARLRHLKDAGQIADDLLARFQLTDAAGRRVSTYSGGMRRRLDIAMSLIGKAPVIFLDEPTTGLDPQSRVEVWNSVRQLAGQGSTVLLTTQNLDEAEQLADRIAILHQGRIIANGTLAELKQLFPPAKVEYVEKQPTLEDIFLAITGNDRTDSAASADN
jgi:ABC-2 type transport system ATP-binding protein